MIRVDEESGYYALAVEGVWIRPIRWLGLYAQCKEPHLLSQDRTKDNEFAEKVRKHVDEEGKQLKRFLLDCPRYID